MFPLDEDTAVLLLLLLASACTATFVASRGGMRPLVFLLLCLLAFLWPWSIPLTIAMDHALIGFAAYVGTASLAAFATGTAFGLGARRVASGGAAAALAVLPALAGSAYLLERQRVPGAPCAKSATFEVGDMVLRIPRGTAVRSAVSKDGPEQAWDGVYSDWPGNKRDVRAFCHATDGGHDALQVHHLWFSSYWFAKRRKEICADARPAGPLGRECSALARTRLTVFQLYARPDGAPSPTLSFFNSGKLTAALAAGKDAGYRCNKTGPLPNARHCTIWLRPTPGVLAVSSAWLGPAKAAEDPVADARLLLETLFARLSGERAQ